jgi:hypothetical protein
MKIEQRCWTAGQGWRPAAPGAMKDPAHLVLVFGATSLLRDHDHLTRLGRIYPGAHILGCSTAGEIHGTRVLDDSLVVTAVHFESTPIQGAKIKLDTVKSSREAGERLARHLKSEGLAHVFVLSDGLKVNGSDLVKGLVDNLPPHVSVTGGLSGDGSRFQETLVAWDGPAEPDTVAVLGLYGERIKVGYGSLGGWDSFGPERLITRSDGNVLYELDGGSALELYKQYLGEHAKGLPATGLLFPLSVRRRDAETGVVRTILSVDERHQSMTFAGDIPTGSYARLMKANFDRLIDGAVTAAKTSSQAIGSSGVELALLVSCVGRKMVLSQRIEEEVEGVRDVVGDQAILAGFYSYGEISPFTASAACELHNQTMTVTTLSER